MLLTRSTETLEQGLLPECVYSGTCSNQPLLRADIPSPLTQFRTPERWGVGEMGEGGPRQRLLVMK